MFPGDPGFGFPPGDPGFLPAGDYVVYNPSTGLFEAPPPLQPGDEGYNPLMDPLSALYDSTYNPSTDPLSALYNPFQDETNVDFNPFAVPGSDNFNENIWMTAVSTSDVDYSNYGVISDDINAQLNDIELLSLEDPEAGAEAMDAFWKANKNELNGLQAASQGWDNINAIDTAFTQAYSTQETADLFISSEIVGDDFFYAGIDDATIEEAAIKFNDTDIDWGSAGVTQKEAVNASITLTDSFANITQDTPDGDTARVTVAGIFSDPLTVSKYSSAMNNTASDVAGAINTTTQEIITPENVARFATADGATATTVTENVNSTVAVATGALTGTMMEAAIVSAVTATVALSAAVKKTSTQTDRDNAIAKLGEPAKTWCKQGAPTQYKSVERVDPDGNTVIIWTALVATTKDDLLPPLTADQQELFEKGTYNKVKFYNNVTSKYEWGLELKPDQDLTQNPSGQEDTGGQTTSDQTGGQTISGGRTISGGQTIKSLGSFGVYVNPISYASEWKPSWLRGSDENVVVKITNNRTLKAPLAKRKRYTITNTNNKNTRRSTSRSRNTRAISSQVKAEVLVKVKQMITAFTTNVTRDLTRNNGTTNGILEKALTAIVKSANVPDLTLVKNYVGNNPDPNADPDTDTVKRAVLIGINYTANDKLNTLSGCINDAAAMRGMLIDTYAYKDENVTVLRDDGKDGFTLPTRANIIQAIKNVVAQSADKDEIWIHYSGHGSFVVDEGNDEVDKRDEGILPSDFDEDTIRIILDDELKTLFNNVKGTVMITQDCCNSGTGWDLPYMYTRQASGSYARSVESPTFNQTTTKNIYMLSGSRDDQLAVETGERFGAFTDALMECLRRRSHRVSLFNLENDINELLKERQYEQRTVFTSANYNASQANITRSMFMSSNVPPYRARSAGDVLSRYVPHKKLQLKNEQDLYHSLAVNNLKRITFM